VLLWACTRAANDVPTGGRSSSDSRSVLFLTFRDRHRLHSHLEWAVAKAELASSVSQAREHQC
jgi:hypothetical protein